MKEAKGKASTSGGNTDTAASLSNAQSSSLTVPEAEGDADTDGDVSTGSPIKAEPQEVEVADMLLVPEPISAPAEASTTAPGDQDVEMAGVQPEPTPVVPTMDYNPAMTNAQGEPLMAMMTDEAVADISAPAPPANTLENQVPSGDGLPIIPPEVVAALAGATSSSSRHRHGESSTTQARLKLLREKPEIVSRFLFLVVPILFDVFSASVTVQVRMRCFLGILKATSFLDGAGMEVLYKVCNFIRLLIKPDCLQNVPVASFIGSLLTTRDSPMLVTNALQLVELLLVKCPAIFRTSLRKEGVLHEVSTISKIELKIKAKPVPPPDDATAGDNADANPSEEGSVPPPVVPVPPRKSSSVPTDPQDAYVLRARFIKVKYLSGGSDVGGDTVFESLKSMIKALGDAEASSEQLSATLKEIAKLFGNASSGAAISSFELLKSGLVDGLLAFATDSGRQGSFYCSLNGWILILCSGFGKAQRSVLGCLFG